MARPPGFLCPPEDAEVFAVDASAAVSSSRHCIIRGSLGSMSSSRFCLLPHQSDSSFVRDRHAAWLSPACSDL